MISEQRSISEYVRAYWPQINAARQTTRLTLTTIAKALILKAPNSEGWTVESVTRIIRRVAKCDGEDRSISESDAAMLASVGLDVTVPATLPERRSAQLALGDGTLGVPAAAVVASDSDGAGASVQPERIASVAPAAVHSPEPSSAQSPGSTGRASREVESGRSPAAPPTPAAATSASPPPAASRSERFTLSARESLLD